MKQHDLLKKSVLFHGLDQKEIDSLLAVSREKFFAAEEIIIRKGDLSSCLYIILSGSACTLTKDYQGKEIVSHTFYKGDYFGEMSFIDGERRSATIKAAEDSSLLMIPQGKFRQVLRENPDCCLNMMKGLSRKVRETTKQVEDLVFIVVQKELDDAHLDTINRLALAAECKDDNTGDHLIRVSRYCGLIAEKYGLPAEQVENIRNAASMHDVGKIGIPEKILLKPGKLTREEFEVIKTHTRIGAKILSNPKSNLLKTAYRIAMNHHEKFNGQGYPAGLRGQAIPIEARIVSLVDTFDTLISRRPYKPPLSIQNAFDIIEKERGQHFDPEIVDLFLHHREEILQITETVSEQSAKLR